MVVEVRATLYSCSLLRLGCYVRVIALSSSHHFEGFKELGRYAHSRLVFPTQILLVLKLGLQLVGFLGHLRLNLLLAATTTPLLLRISPLTNRAQFLS